jgi:hypothetical protein
MEFPRVSSACDEASAAQLMFSGQSTVQSVSAVLDEKACDAWYKEGLLQIE